MKNLKKYLSHKYATHVVILILLLGSALAFYCYQESRERYEDNMTLDENATTTDANGNVVNKTTNSKGYTSNNAPKMKNYINEEYNFIIDYNANLQPIPSVITFHDLSNRWRLGVDNYNGKGIVTIPIFKVDVLGSAVGKPYPLFYTAEVRVGVSDSVEGCYDLDKKYPNEKVTDVMINGRAFKRFDFSDAGMMKYVSGSSYRTIKDNKCFAIEQVRNGSSYRDETMTKGLSQATLDAYYAQAGRVVQSFRFTK